MSTVRAEELCEELERMLSEHFGGHRRIQRLRRRRSNYASSYRIENLEVQLDDGKRLSLVFKDLSAGSLLKEARDVRPSFLYRPQREIETYRSVLDPEQLGTAICYGATQRLEVERYWLVLERVKGPLLWQIGRIESWKRAAHWLARLHSRFSNGHRRPVPDLPESLVRYDQEYYRRWMERARRFLSERSDLLDPELHDGLERLASNYEQVVARLLSLPQTLIHGEFYPSNVILRGGAVEKRVCPIDWEVAAIGPGLMDLAALSSGNWTAEQKQVLVRAYRDRLEPSHGWPPPMKELSGLVEHCQLHLAVQWLGWAPDWTPPRNHGQNWLQEAVGLSKRLGIIS